MRKSASPVCLISPAQPRRSRPMPARPAHPAGAPATMMAAGGSQLRGVLEDDGIYVWKYPVDWADPSKSKAEGPVKIPVAPYHYLGGGQLTNTVPQPGSNTRLDSQGDKLMA